MKKQYVIESKGFTQGIGSSKYIEKRKKQKEELKRQIAELKKLAKKGYPDAFVVNTEKYK